MCFSASASFGAGLILTTISIITIKKVDQPSKIYFATIPIIFCIQQFSEGFLWLALTNPKFAPLQNITIYIFLFLAQTVWPFWFPLAILKLETDNNFKKILKIPLGIGIMVSLYLGYCLLFYSVEAKIIGSHISYIQHYPILFGNYGDLLYILATTGPAFLSGIKRMWLLGLIIFISYIISALFYNDYIISVWCFFASIISIVISILIPQMENPNQEETIYHH